MSDDIMILQFPSGTIATEAKQDDIIDALGNISGGVTYATNDILDNSGNTYFFKESKDGAWYVQKLGTAGFTHATVTNNPTVTTYAAARSGYASLTYGNYSSAF